MEEGSLKWDLEQPRSIVMSALSSIYLNVEYDKKETVMNINKIKNKIHISIKI